MFILGQSRDLIWLEELEAVRLSGQVLMSDRRRALDLVLEFDSIGTNGSKIDSKGLHKTV